MAAMTDDHSTAEDSRERFGWIVNNIPVKVAKTQVQRQSGSYDVLGGVCREEILRYVEVLLDPSQKSVDGMSPSEAVPGVLARFPRSPTRNVLQENRRLLSVPRDRQLRDLGHLQTWCCQQTNGQARTMRARG